MSDGWKIDENPEAWRAELLRIYDEAYARTHGPKPDDDESGSRVRRKPKPAPTAPSVALEPVGVHQGRETEGWGS